ELVLEHVKKICNFQPHMVLKEGETPIYSSNINAKLARELCKYFNIKEDADIYCIDLNSDNPQSFRNYNKEVIHFKMFKKIIINRNIFSSPEANLAMNRDIIILIKNKD